MKGLVAAFDTSGPLGSVAVARDGEIRARRFLVRRGEHGSHLVPALEDALRDEGAVPAHLDGVVVGAGPGSFTGIRVAAATARGLVRAVGASLFAFSSLAAAAVAHGSRLPDAGELPPSLRGSGPEADADPPPAGERRCVLFDARAQRGYAATYRVEAGGLEEVHPPEAVTLEEVLEREPPGTVLCGDGALRHVEALEGAGFTVVGPPLGVPTAEGLLALLRLHPDPRPVGDPGRWTPDYLRPVGARPTLTREERT